MLDSGNAWRYILGIIHNAVAIRNKVHYVNLGKMGILGKMVQYFLNNGESGYVWEYGTDDRNLLEKVSLGKLLQI